MKILYIFISVKIYTGEDLKWDTPTGGVISNSYRYRSIAELKCPILILQWCKTDCGRPPLGLCSEPSPVPLLWRLKTFGFYNF